MNDVWGAFAAAAVIGILNALLPPIVAALRLPLMALVGFLLVLVLDAAMLLAADAITGGDLHVDGFWAALGVALVAAAAGLALGVLFGVDDEGLAARDRPNRASREGPVASDAPGIVFLEIDGLALGARVARCATARTEPGGVAGKRRTGLVEWETDLSSQTGASQAGILLGSNDDIPAFRWVEKETATMVVCSGPADCAELERRHSSGNGLLANGGAEPRQPLLRRGRQRDPDGQQASTPSGRRTPATGRSWRTASTSRGRWRCSSRR